MFELVPCIPGLRMGPGAATTHTHTHPPTPTPKADTQDAVGQGRVVHRQNQVLPPRRGVHAPLVDDSIDRLHRVVDNLLLVALLAEAKDEDPGGKGGCDDIGHRQGTQNQTLVTRMWDAG